MSNILLPLRAEQSVFPPSELFTTPAQFNNSTSPATTAFVQRALGNLSATVKITSAMGGTNLTAANAGNLIEFNIGAAATAIFAPALSALNDGASITFSNLPSNAVATVTHNGSDLFYGNNLAGVTSFTLNGGECATWTKCVTDGIWVLASSNVNFFGLPQTWQDMTGSRAFGTNFTNSTGREIKAIVYSATSTVTMSVIVAGVTLVSIATGGGYGNGPLVPFTIPAGATYSVNCAGPLTIWSEER
jgi:hypothetical protein